MLCFTTTSRLSRRLIIKRKTENYKSSTGFPCAVLSLQSWQARKCLVPLPPSHSRRRCLLHQSAQCHPGSAHLLKKIGANHQVLAPHKTHKQGQQVFKSHYTYRTVQAWGGIFRTAECFSVLMSTLWRVGLGSASALIFWNWPRRT